MSTAGSGAQAAPAVSVILPTYRRGELIGRALRSVLEQSFADLEVIVIDDMPGDNTEEVVRSFGDARVRYISHSARRGVAAARNQGLGLARGRYVAFQDSDDEWLMDKLSHQVQRLESLGPDFALTQAAVLWYGAGRARYLFSALPSGNERSAILPVNNTTFLQGWLARRDALLAAGGFDEQLRVWEDWELLIRVCQRFRVDMDPRPAALIYDTPNGLTREGQGRVEALQVILSKHGALLHAEPAALANNLYALGRFELLAGRPADARRSLLASLRLRPLQLKTWAMLAMSVLGQAFVRRIVDWRDARA